MCRQHSPRNQFREAVQIARDHGMYVVERPAGNGVDTDYILYRKTAGRSLRLGRRRDIGDFRRFVERCAACAERRP